MTNHPNRNWRARMRQSCEDWLLRWIRDRDSGRALDSDDLREAYRAGFEAGRSPPRPPSIQEETHEN